LEALPFAVAAEMEMSFSSRRKLRYEAGRRKAEVPRWEKEIW
jgi:hypothetical protein